MNNEQWVQTQHGQSCLTLRLNRPETLNTLNQDMIRKLHQDLQQAAQDDQRRFVILCGAGARGFCAGGDIKAMAKDVHEGLTDQVLRFLKEEYALDLFIYEMNKPVVLLAQGICMGGGLGLAAGADFVVADETTRMSMPESRIGFFPDVGATGWLFDKCPPGYPEFLGLTGYELRGLECVRTGLASHCVAEGSLLTLQSELESLTLDDFPGDSQQLRSVLQRIIETRAIADRPEKPTMDHWVLTHFSNADSVSAIRDSLQSCSNEHDLCRFVFSEFEARSPTSLALTMKLLRRNQGLTMAEVFEADLRAASFMLDHHDFVEGVRARLLDKDNKPRWSPEEMEDVDLSSILED